MEAMEAGTLVGDKYLLVRQIGRGGMGAVWAARNVRTEREVALKLITDENADYRARLLREARACGRISHRNVIEIYDVGETASGAPFLVMPLLEGEPLSRKLRRDGAMAPPIAAQIATEIARALSAAHAAGIIHRDLKPANIYLHREPGSEMLVVKVLDFGISKVVSTDSTTTTTGTILGSPAYMSPEQAKGERYVDHRSDLWSLGVTLFEMLTGRRPFQGESMFTVVAAVLGGPVPHVRELLPHIDPGLAEVAARCMERELDYRAQYADEIVHMLRPYAAGYLPLDLSAFGASGFHPVASMSQMPTAPHMADSASVPPVHFAAPWGGPPGAPTIASGPPPGVRQPVPRGSFPSISVSTASASISGLAAPQPPGPSAPPPSGPEPFSGSTTAAGSMVHAAPPPRAPSTSDTATPDFRPRSSTMVWIVAGTAFVALAVLAGVIIGMSANSGPTTTAGPGDSALQGSPGAGATSGGPATTTTAPVASATASAGHGTPIGTESPATSGQATTGQAGSAGQAGTTGQAGATGQAGSGAAGQAGSGAAGSAGGKPVSTGGKPTATAKPGKPPKGGGVTVPDDPG
jgi:eukaryotic-like serine/threonine-protein kinase